jgi:hypothetical protein
LFRGQEIIRSAVDAPSLCTGLFAKERTHMASWIEIDRVRKDPVAFKSLAKRLLADPQYERSEFADGFLEDISNYKRYELTSRQSEVLLAMRDEAEIHFAIKGLSVATLIDRCHLNRVDLEESDQGRIENLKAQGRRFVRGNEMGWFKRICKDLAEMERYM